MPVGTHYALYASATGGLRIAIGQRAEGVDARIALDEASAPLPDAIAARFRFVADGATLALSASARARIGMLLRQQLVLAREDGDGNVLAATALQAAGALDDAYAAAESVEDLGVRVSAAQTRFRLWAPTALAVHACTYADDEGPSIGRFPLRRDDATGAWAVQRDADLSGAYYAYLVDVFVPGTGIVRNRVTDPYSVGLGADSKRSYVADLDSAALKPPGWDATAAPVKVRTQTDMTIYELHVRDFSLHDATVPAAHRGKYLAFADAGSNGMRHLRALSDAGLTDIHLLPVFDFASVPETDCAHPTVPRAAPDSEAQQAAVMAQAADDCFNWGYDPYHFNAPEGSYATDAHDGAVRIREFRAMVQALHRAGLRVGMDVVYNHTMASGQRPASVLDRIVPGYYHRLDADGLVERSTCCDNTATEHAMMAKLMIDSAVLWATQYRIDSFRFDLMGHQPRAAMEWLRARVDAAAGRPVQLIGEGWNFGEVADGKRFVQASQRSLGGSGIGTFSDRARDALRGGGPADSGAALVAQRGWINGLADDPAARAEAAHAADLVRVGLAGSLRGYVVGTASGFPSTLDGIDYKGQSAGYASSPTEVVNYVENHDNQTLFDINAYKLPSGTDREDRVRAQMLGVAVTALSQGIAYFHAGVDTLRSKSMDRNSFDSGDWFNRLDWTHRDNFFGTGLPPKQDNGRDYTLIAPRLVDAGIKPRPREIALARDMFRDLLRIRASSTLFRLATADDVQRRLKFFNAGRTQDPALIAAHLDGAGLGGARFGEILYLINAGSGVRTLSLTGEAGKPYRLHPVHRAPGAADKRPARDARFDRSTGRFTVPPRTVVVYVIEAQPIAAMAASASTPDLQTFFLDAGALSPKLKATVLLPPGYADSTASRHPVLYMNDGQDFDEVGVAGTLAQLERDAAIEPPIVVAIDMPPDRMGAYGLSDRAASRSLVGASRYGPIGTHAHAYSEWVARTLVPYVDAHYRTRRDPRSRAVLGWSLGALNAFNLGWRYPEVFGRVGAFSPSFWIASDQGDAHVSQRRRLAQAMVDAGPKREGLALWLAVGDKEETDDRDQDGINDALDDVRDLVEGYRDDAGFSAKGLTQWGYATSPDPASDAQVVLHVVGGGIHHQSTWKTMLPAFLAWAYGAPGESRATGMPHER